MINVLPGLSKEAIVKKVLDYFESNRDSLCSLKYTVRSQGKDGPKGFHYSPVHLAVVFKRTEILDVLYKHIKENKEFARQVLTLRVLDVQDMDPSRTLQDKENKRYEF